ncbi:cyclic nucleotide-binding domain-containing protein [bacterium]|nr:MAG: cyclic nucleotide-binding domain-containing protein [bacterium]
MDSFIDSYKLSEPIELVNQLKTLLEADFPDKFELKEYEIDDLIFREGQSNRILYILLSGTIELSKYNKSDIPVKVDWIRPGSLFGVLSFTTGRSTLTFAKAKSKSEVLEISLPNFERIRKESTVFYDVIGQLFIQNLIERYIHVVSIHMELDELHLELQKERNNLKLTLGELQASQERLVNQEKMAILGQLVAGFAHEVNNPAGALINSIDFLSSDLPELLKIIPTQTIPPVDAFNWGIQQESVSTLKTRELSKQLEQNYPELERSVIRKIAQLPKQVVETLEQEFKASIKKGDITELLKIINLIELGIAFKGMNVSARRIAELVQSMKNYARQGNAQLEDTNIKSGLNDTMLILSNRLKKRTVILDLEDVPETQAVVGELNQVWTNILINACDATSDGNRLKISCGELNGLIWVQFEDEGPGVPDIIKDRIFEANFTTKNSSGHFGLGLGLAITYQIIKKHNGEIEVGRSKELGGASFTVWLPIQQGF